MFKVYKKGTDDLIFGGTNHASIPKTATMRSDGDYEMVYVEPEEVEVVDTAEPISIPIFKTLFTLTERVNIDTSEDPGVKILWADVSDVRTTEIRLDLPSVVEGITYLETVGVIDEGRAAEILAFRP